VIHKHLIKNSGSKPEGNWQPEEDQIESNRLNNHDLQTFSKYPSTSGHVPSEIIEHLND